MATVNILVKVDTVKLQQEFPRGGKVTNREIIVMEDGQRDSTYTDSEGGRYKDKLNSKVDAGDAIFWTISAKNSDRLEFTSCDDAELVSKIVQSRPQPVSSDKSNWNAPVKSAFSVHVSAWYTYSFKIVGTASPVWSWDPEVESRPH